MDCDGECDDGTYDSDSQGAVDAVPPRAMGARVADKDEEGDAEEKLADADEVEKLGVTEERHVCVGLAVQCRVYKRRSCWILEARWCILTSNEKATRSRLGSRKLAKCRCASS